VPARYIIDAATFRDAVTLGVTREDRVLEFKERYAANDHARRELRKDVMALANTFGGTILVGVVESQDAGYARAIALADPNVKDAVEWINSTLQSKLYPLPQHELRVIAGEGVPEHGLLAINVHPFSDGVGVVEFDDGTIRVPARGQDRVRFLDGREALAAMSAAHVRRMLITLEEIAAKPGQRIHIASPIWSMRLETPLEHKTRLRRNFNLSGWNGERAPLPAEFVETREMGLVAYLQRFDERVLMLAVDSSMLAVPHRLVREVWRHADSTSLGMILDCDIVITNVPALSIELRTR
jgi:hypothetical protein